MNHNFLGQLLHFAQDVTQAERGLSVSKTLEVIENHNIDEGTLNSTSFKNFVNPLLTQAIESGRTIITNNIITDPAQAPNTNTNFSDLRIVIVMPVKDTGAIYLDQPIRFGIIQREIIDRINQMVNQLMQENKDDANEADMLEIYNKIP